MEEKTFSEKLIEKSKKNWLKIIGFSLVGFLLLSGTFYTGYLYGIQKSTIAPPKLAIPTPTLAPLPTPTPTPGPTADWKTFTNTKYRYSIKIPPDWGIISAHTGEVLPGLTSELSSELIGDGKGFPPQAIEIEVRSNFTKEQFLKEHKQVTVECREIKDGKILCGYTRFLIQKDKDLYIISDVRGLSNFDLILSTFKFLD